MSGIRATQGFKDFRMDGGGIIAGEISHLDTFLNSD